jgi:ubiquinone/menaquinone biosynthesis C-methylase UbiE
LGTGPGFLALDFHPLAGRLIGIDPEAAMLRKARQIGERAGADIAFIQASAADLGSHRQFHDRSVENQTT